MRFNGVWSAFLANPTVVNVTPSKLVSQDQTDYGSGSPRYSYVRYEEVRVWVGSDDIAVSPLEVSVQDSGFIADTVAVGGAVIQDQLNAGVDWAVIAYKPNLMTRLSWQKQTDGVSVLFNVTITSNAPAVVTQSTGNYVVDVLCHLR